MWPVHAEPLPAIFERFLAYVREFVIEQPVIAFAWILRDELSDRKGCRLSGPILHSPPGSMEDAWPG